MLRLSLSYDFEVLKKLVSNTSFPKATMSQKLQETHSGHTHTTIQDFRRPRRAAIGTEHNQVIRMFVSAPILLPLAHHPIETPRLVNILKRPLQWRQYFMVPSLRDMMGSDENLWFTQLGIHKIRLLSCAEDLDQVFHAPCSHQGSCAG